MISMTKLILGLQVGNILDFSKLFACNSAIQHNMDISTGLSHKDYFKQLNIPTQIILFKI